MGILTVEDPKKLTCKIPRKKEAVKALLGLAWRKTKKERPNWLVKELKSYFNENSLYK